MNNRYIYLSFIFLIAGALSCKKVLNVTPYSSFTDATAFTTVDRIELAIAGVYDAAQSGFYPEGLAPRGYPFGSANIEQSDCRGEDMVNMETFYQATYNSTYVSNSPNCTNMWNNCYALINKANLTIEGVQGALTGNVINQQQEKSYEAECRFLKAMAMHELLIQFARPFAEGQGNQPGVIIRDFAIKDDATIAQAGGEGRSSVADCYKAIESDLDFAEANLPETRGTLSSVRATKAAAIALKMRVFLHEQKWSDVIVSGSKLVNSNGPSFISPIGKWTLTATPDGPFKDNKSVESIFSIENSNVDNSSVSGAMQSMYGSNGSDVGARGLIGISPIVYNLAEWDLTDLRRSQLITPNFTGGNPATAPSGKKPMLFTTKYRDKAWGDYAPQIRYAEVLLMLAEAYARQSSTVDTKALALLNAVRNRAVTTVSKQYTAASFATANALIKAILAERRIEFIGEGKRWPDIHRLALDPEFNNSKLAGNTTATIGGIPAKFNPASITAANFNTIYSGTASYSSIPKTFAALPYSDYHFIWPLPQNEITQSVNNVVTQNPNY